MNPTESSLAEQMHLHELEIARRKQLLGFTQDDVDALASVQRGITEQLEAIVREFYERQTEIEEIALIIGDSETLRRLRSAQSHYIADLFSGVYDEDYVNNRLRIGMVHKRIGVEPKYYLSAVKVLKDILKATLRAQVTDNGLLSRVLEALDKLLYFDTELVFDTYIRSLVSEIESAKERAERYARSLEQKVAERTRELAELSRMDPLTGLLNQRAFMDAVRGELTRARRMSTPLALAYIDLDAFKQINDREGHSRGDEVLKALARTAQEIKRGIDVAARYGGDEFCIAFPDTDITGAVQFVERLWQRFVSRTEITFSVGVAHTGPQHFESVEELVSRADACMYEMKRDHHENPATIADPWVFLAQYRKPGLPAAGAAEVRVLTQR